MLGLCPELDSSLLAWFCVFFLLGRFTWVQGCPGTAKGEGTPIVHPQLQIDFFDPLYLHRHPHPWGTIFYSTSVLNIVFHAAAELLLKKKKTDFCWVGVFCLLHLKHTFVSWLSCPIFPEVFFIYINIRFSKV